MEASPAPAEIVTSDREKDPSDRSAPVVRPRARLWASRRAKPSSNDTIDPSTDDDKSSVEVEKGKSDGPPKVGFFKLFRFATTAELGLDVLGIVAAVAAGAAQPLMTLILGRFTTSFTTFATVLIQLSTDPTNEQLRTAFRQAQDAVKADTSRNAIWLTIIGAGNFVAIYIFMCTWIYSGERLSKRIREKYLQAVLRQDIEFFDKVGAGEVATRIQTDTHLIQEGVSEKVALTAMYMSTFVTGYVLAYIRCWRLALAITSVLPVMAILGGAAGYFVSKYSTQNLEHKAASGTLAEEVLSTVRTVKSFSMVQKFGALFEVHVEASKRIGYKVALAMGVVTGGMFFVIYCGYSIALVYGARLINQGRADSGIVITVLFSIFIGSFSIMMMATQVNSVFKAMGAASKIYETIDRVPPIDSADEGGLKPSTCEGRLTFEGTSFHYPSRPGITVLSDFTASFPPGKTTALVGASGSGKTTIVSLLLRFYDPVTGSVKLDGHDLRDLNLKWLRQQIGYVQQEPVLFMQSVRTNIEFGLLGTCHENASPEEKLQLVKAAAIKSNAHEFVSLLPDGYDTHVGEGGLLLSGGQKQRIAIARAIVSDPTILLLDEATSALDTVSEGLVQEALDRASAGRTTVTIAHRLSTVKDAHQIIVMGNGKLLECGSHQTLLAQDGNYAQQVLAQNLRGNDLGQSSTTLAGGLSNSDAVASEEKGGARKDLQDVEEAVQELEKGGATAAVDNKPSTSLLPYRTLGKRLYQINNSDRVYYMSGCIFALASGFVFPGFSILFGQAISNFSEPNPSRLQTKSDRTALWIFVVAIISALVEGLQNWTFMRTADGLEAKVRSLSFRAMLRNDVAWYDEPEHTTGSLTSRLTEDATKITGLAGMTLGKIFAAFATILAGAVIGLAYGWELALIAIACMPVILSMGYIELHVVRLKDQKNKEQHEESAHLACEAAGAIKTVASLTRENDACRTYNRSLEEPLRKSKRTMLKANALFAFSQAANLWVVALIFWIGSRWLVDLRYSVNDFFVILQASVFGATQAGGVFAFVPDASKAQQAATDVIRLLDQRPKIDLESTEGKVSHAAARGHLRFDNVSFGYPTRSGSLVLRDLTIDAPPGSYIALVGASGCGKSTTIQLIERFYDPLSGTITLDGVPISDLNVTSYRSQVALVSQEPTLYAGSIKFNILLGANRPEEEISQEEIVNACRNANILEFIESLPDGFDTAVGGKGAQLSGGQKQRIAIARALIRNPKVLLLDEATSALDSSSEKVVQAALDNAAKGRTTIAIAHRLSTVQRADRIYFIKEGGVAEQGTHEELLKLGGDYAQLVGLQVLSKVD